MTFSAEESLALFNQLEQMKDSEFVNEFKQTAKSERHATVRTCHFINELERRRCFDLLGAPTAFAYLTRIEGFSEGSANRRIQSARYLRLLPNSAEKIASGELSMDAIATIQRAVRETEKKTGTEISIEARADLLNRLERKSIVDVQKTLAAEFPQAAPKQEIIQYVNESEVRTHLTLPAEVLEKYQRIAELLSHELKSAKLADVMDAAADKLLSLIDPLKIEVTPCKKRNPETTSISNSDRNFVLRRDFGECQAVLADGSKCRSKFKVQVDHILERANGGSSLPENLQCLCRHHNFQKAEKTFGKKHMAQFLKN